MRTQLQRLKVHRSFSSKLPDNEVPEVKIDSQLSEKAPKSAVKGGLVTVAAPIPLKELVSSKSNHEQIKKIINASCRSFQPSDAPVQFGYPLNHSTVAELEALIKAKSSNPHVRLPSMDLGIIATTCHYAGSEIMLEKLVKTICERNKMKFIKISNNELFPRLSGSEIVHSPPLRAGNELVRETPIRNGRRRSIGGNGNVQVISLNLDLRDLKDESDHLRTDDTPHAPYPWFKGFVDPASETPFLLSNRIPDVMENSKTEQSKLLFDVFNKFFDMIPQSKEPIVVFYSDFIRLLNADDPVAAKESIKVFNQALQRRRRKMPSLLAVLSNTTTYSLPSKVSSKKNKLVNALFGAEDEDSFDKDASGSNMPPSSSNNNHVLALFDSVLGLTNVHIFPPLEPRQFKQFKDLVDEDHRSICLHENYLEVELSAVTSDIKWEVTEKMWTDIIQSMKKKRTRLDSSFIYAKDAEKLLMLALSGDCSDKPTINEGNLKAACDVFVQSSYNQQVMMTDAKYAYAFKEDYNLVKSLSKYERRIMKQCLVRPDVILTKFSSIGGLAKTKQVVNELIRLPLQRPELFQTGILRQTTTGILLFGPPGTGKTLLARAVAGESGANFLNVQMSHLSSMWVGENEKNIRGLFSLARKLKPCVIFVDEIDSLLKARHGNNPSYVTNTINEFMQEWDGVHSEGGVMVIGATNRPFDLDDAVLRRLPRRLLVNLPDEEERKEILQVLLAEEKILDRDEVISRISREKGFFSGSDLKNLSIAAALNAVREQNSINQSVDRTLEYKHFIQAIKTGDVVPSVSERTKLLKHLKDWDNVYGTGAKSYGKGTGAWGF